jgi:hypothetical protein
MRDAHPDANRKPCSHDENDGHRDVKTAMHYQHPELEPMGGTLSMFGCLSSWETRGGGPRDKDNVGLVSPEAAHWEKTAECSAQICWKM